MNAAVEHGAFANLEKTTDGKLRIALTVLGRSEWGEIEQWRDHFGIHAALIGLLADHLASGWEEVRPEEIGALTSALLLSDDVERDDEGQVVDCGTVYWNPLYQIQDEIEELRERGSILFHPA